VLQLLLSAMDACLFPLLSLPPWESHTRAIIPQITLLALRRSSREGNVVHMHLF
jgi:hypothetical protein